MPGYGETLRVNGVLRLAPTPRIEVREVFLHCAKAVIRSRLWDDPEPGAVPSADGGTIVADGLWDPALRVPVGELPRGSRIWTDHVRLNEDPGEEAELVRQLIQEEPLAEGLAQDYAENLY